MLYQAGIFITFFLFLILITKKGKTLADFILASWLLVIGIHLAFFYLFISGQLTRYPYLLGLQIPLPLFHGPFLYFYVAAATNQLPHRPIRWLHAVPILIAYLIMVPFFRLSNNEKIRVFQNDGEGFESIVLIVFIAIILSGICYTLLSLHLLRRHKRNIVHQFSDTEKINLNWISYLIAGMCVIWALVIFLDDEFIFGAVVGYVLFIGYFGIKQVGIFTHKTGQAVHVTNSQEVYPVHVNSDADLTKDSNGKQPAKYARSALSEEDASKIHLQLRSIMKEKSLYQIPELSLSYLSDELGIQPNLLSQVINSKEGKNFYDFINAWRINEFIKMAGDESNNHFTLLALALECGFNSKTSFNRNFKKVTGLSPSTYLKEQKITLEQ